MAKASAKIGCLSQQRRHPSAFCCSRVLSQPLPPQPYPPFHLLLPSPSPSLTFFSLFSTHTAQRIALFSRALRSHVHASVPAHQPVPDPSHKNSHTNSNPSIPSSIIIIITVLIYSRFHHPSPSIAPLLKIRFAISGLQYPCSTRSDVVAPGCAQPSIGGS